MFDIDHADRAEMAREDLRAEFPTYRCPVCGTRRRDDHKHDCGADDEDGTETPVNYVPRWHRHLSSEIAS